MSDDVSKEELYVAPDILPVGEPLGVAPTVLAAFIVCVLAVIALMFVMAFFIDRWKTGASANADGNGRGVLNRSSKVTILNDMCEDPTSDPPSAVIVERDVSLPGTSTSTEWSQ